MIRSSVSLEPFLLRCPAAEDDDEEADSGLGFSCRRAGGGFFAGAAAFAAAPFVGVLRVPEAAAALPKSMIFGEWPTASRKATSPSDDTDTDRSLRSGCVHTVVSAATNEASNATLTALAASLMAANGETAPFATPRRVSQSVKRRFALSLIPSNLGSAFMSTVRSGITVTSHVAPDFLSLSSRFFVSVASIPLSVASIVSTVGTSSWAYSVCGIDSAVSFSSTAFPASSGIFE
mmetsp:Transcript_9138/g.37487  ORF Transcript_9138/g.37487 Transcript_9138/m.37487 type:complete len:234 (-) Transcript_9138:154-855(-)